MCTLGDEASHPTSAPALVIRDARLNVRFPPTLVVPARVCWHTKRDPRLPGVSPHIAPPEGSRC
jgi:hypothetical protein